VSGGFLTVRKAVGIDIKQAWIGVEGKLLEI
jgi:hypothetical protein